MIQNEINEDCFVRIENKYLLNDEQAQNLIPILQSYLVNASPVPSTDYTIIESVYFDNMDLYSLNEYLAQNNNRSKMRTRKYAPNGCWDNEIFVELKSKVDGISKKSRLKMTNIDVKNLYTSETLIRTSELEFLNTPMKISKIEKRLENINIFLNRLKAIPTCKVSYSRIAYESKNDHFRVTLDKNIKFQMLTTLSNDICKKINSNESFNNIMNLAQEKFSKNSHVLEIKHSGTIPQWMNDFLNLNNIEKVSFSKYCYAMSFTLKEKVVFQTINESVEAL